MLAYLGSERGERVHSISGDNRAQIRWRPSGRVISPLTAPPPTGLVDIYGLGGEVGGGLVPIRGAGVDRDGA